MTQVYFNCKIDINGKEVFKRVRISNHNPLRQAAGFVRKIARQQIKFRADPHNNAPVGSPPYTHVGRRRKGVMRTISGLKNSIMFALKNDRSDTLQLAVVGSSFQIIDKIGKLHEFGGTRFGGVNKEGIPVNRIYPERPFMQPALQKSLPYLPKFWERTLR